MGEVISIHALREEGDVPCFHFTTLCFDFYPRPPRGGRLGTNRQQPKQWRFLSTPSARRATTDRSATTDQILISIHALREEGDLFSHFFARFRKISIHALREEGDLARGGSRYREQVFLSTPSARRATAKTERKHPAFVSLYTSLHKLQRDACKPNRKITPLLAQTAGIPVRSVPENHVCCRFALAGHQKISTLSWANFGCSPTCSTLVW